MASETHLVELIVPDLCCVECGQGVVTALHQAPGVCDFQVLGMSEKVRVTYDETIQPEQLVQAVEQAGHTVTSWRAEGQRVSRDASSSPSRPQGRGVQTFALLRLLFVGFVSLIALLEIAGESLGLLHGVEDLVPWPLALAVVVIGGYPIFRGAFQGLKQRRINTDAVMSVGILAAAAIGEFIGAALIVFFVMTAHCVICRISFPVGRTITCPGVGYLSCFLRSKLCFKNESFDAYLPLWSHLGTIKCPLVPC